RGHRMQVQMPDHAEALHGQIDLFPELSMIGFVIAADAIFELTHPQLAVVHGVAIQVVPEQAVAETGFFSGPDLAGPGLGQNVRVDVVELAVHVDVTARKLGAEQGAPMARHGSPELVDIGIFRRTENGRRQHGVEILWVDAAAVWGITHQGNGVCLRQEQAVRLEVRVGEFHQAISVEVAGSPVPATGVPAAMRAESATSFRWQALQCAGAISLSSGRSARHFAMAIGQRGWKAQPAGGLAGDGSSPAIGSKRRLPADSTGSSLSRAWV